MANLIIRPKIAKITIINPKTGVRVVLSQPKITIRMGGTLTQVAPPSTILGTILAGLSTTTNAVITSADSILSALGKLQKQITDSVTNTSIGNLIGSTATAITSLVDTDQFGVSDSGSSNILKKFSWLNLKLGIKSYYDSVATTLTNKIIEILDTNLLIRDDADPTRQARFNAGSISAGTTRTLSLPNVSDTIVARSSTDTLTNKTLPNPQTTLQTLTPSGTTQTINWDNGSIVDLSLASATGTVALTLTNPKTATSYLIKVTQGATPRNLTFPAGTTQAGGGGVTYTGVANQKDIIAVLYDGANYFISVSYNYS